MANNITTIDVLQMLQTALDQIHRAIPNGEGKGIVNALQDSLNEYAREDGYTKCETCDEWCDKEIGAEYSLCKSCKRDAAEAEEDEQINREYANGGRSK